MRRRPSPIGLVLVVALAAMAVSGFTATHRPAGLPPIPAVAFSTHGIALVSFVSKSGFTLKPSRTLGDTYLLGEFLTVDSTERHYAGAPFPRIHILATQTLKEQWVTFEHERVHMALWAEGVTLPDDVAEKVAEAIAHERVAEMQYKESVLVIPFKP